MKRGSAALATALLLFGTVACGHSFAAPAGDLHFPTTLEATDYTQTATGCDGRGTASVLRSDTDLVVVDKKSHPVQHLRLPSGVIRDGRCMFAVRVELPAGVNELWLATQGGVARNVPLVQRRYAQRDGSSISITFPPHRG